jgi:branched-chain amino acid transport system substrate-binding protein
MILNGSSMDGSYWLNAIPDLSNFYVPVQGSIYGDDPNPKVNEFNKKYKDVTGGDPSSQYVYPGYVLIDVWAKAVERAKSTDAPAVVAELEKMNGEATLFDTEAGKPKMVDQWTISEKIPVDYLVSK